MYIVQRAIEFATQKHDGQIRKASNIPYIMHPVTVMYLIGKFKGNSSHIDELQCAAILHDILEDTDCTYIELEREFGPMVASIVMELTSDESAIKEMGKNEYLKNKMVQMSNYALILKLLDRLANITDHPKAQYLSDTLELINYISKHRDLTDRQFLICEEIIKISQDGLLQYA